jgi:hypothetical protein
MSERTVSPLDASGPPVAWECTWPSGEVSLRRGADAGDFPRGAHVRVRPLIYGGDTPAPSAPPEHPALSDPTNIGVPAPSGERLRPDALSVATVEEVAQGVYECCDFTDCPGVPEGDAPWPRWQELPEEGREYFRDFVLGSVVERDPKSGDPIHDLSRVTHIALLGARAGSPQESEPLFVGYARPDGDGWCVSRLDLGEDDTKPVLILRRSPSGKGDANG